MKISDFKINILRNGVRFYPIDLFTKLSGIESYKTKKIKTKPTIIGDKVYDMANEVNLIPSELLISNDTFNSIVKLRYNENSCYEIKFDGEQLLICTNNKPIQIKIEMVKKYDFLEKEIDIEKNGRKLKVKDFVDIVGIDRISILFFEGCYNWNCNKACKFCDLHPKSIDDEVIKPSINNINQFDSVHEWWKSTRDFYLKGIHLSMLEIEKHKFPHKHLFFMAGNLPTSVDVWKISLDLIEYLSKFIDISSYDSYLNIAPHDSLTNLKKVKKLGIKQVQYNLEIANEQIFEATCPGKLRYNEFLSKMIEAVSIMGYGNVRSNFVFGLQDTNELIEELKKFAVIGITSDYSVFQPKKHTPFHNKKAPNFDDILYFSNELVDIYIKYGLKPIFCSLSSRSSIVNELYNEKNK